MAAQESEEQTFGVKGDHVTLGQLLKFEGLIETGGGVKAFLADTAVLVNGEPEQRRGRKLRPGDRVQIPNGPAVRLIEAEPEDEDDF